MISEKGKLINIGIISIISTSSESRKKTKTKNTSKKHPHNNNQNKGPKPYELTHPSNVDKETKYKYKKTELHCNFCVKYGHVESNYFKKM